MVAEQCVSKSGAVSADPHHTCRYGSSPAAHRLVVPALSFPSDREPSLSHRSRLASFYTRTDQPQPIDAIGPDLRCVHGATSRAALSSCARCRTIALSRPPAPAQDCPGSCCAPPHATASDRTPCRCMFAKRHREDRIDVSFHGSGSVACEDRDGASPFGGSSTPVTGPAGRWPPSQLWAATGHRLASRSCHWATIDNHGIQSAKLTGRDGLRITENVKTSLRE